MDIILRVLGYIELMQPHNILICIIGIVFSALACFLGYRAEKIWSGLLGFVIGAVIGANIAVQFIQNDVIEMLIAIIAGFFVCIIAASIYILGLFLESFFFGFCIAALIVPQLIADDQVTLITCGAIGLVAAILSLIFTKFAVIALTSVFGGFKLADSVLMLIGMSSAMTLVIAGAVAAVAGILVQILTNRHYRLDRGGFVVNER